MITVTDIENNLPELALMLVANNFYGQTNNSSIFIISEYWHAEELKKHADFVIAKTAQEFEAALNMAGDKKILLTVEAGIGEEKVETMLAKGVFCKDVFIEQALVA